jgi:hypothetical protein
MISSLSIDFWASKLFLYLWLFCISIDLISDFWSEIWISTWLFDWFNLLNKDFSFISLSTSSFLPNNPLLGVSTDFGLSLAIKSKLIVLSDLIISWRSGICSKLITTLVISISPLFLLLILLLRISGVNESSPLINKSTTLLVIFKFLNNESFSFFSFFSDLILLLLLWYLVCSNSSSLFVPVNSIFTTLFVSLNDSYFFLFNSISISSSILFFLFSLLYFWYLEDLISTDLVIGFCPINWILTTFLDSLSFLNVGISIVISSSIFLVNLPFLGISRGLTSGFFSY